MTVRIETHPDRFGRASISVDGTDISRFVIGIDIELRPDQLPTATVTMLPASMCIDLPDDMVRLVHAPEDPNDD